MLAIARVICALCARDMLGIAERGTTKLLTSRVKIPYGSAEPYHDTAGVYITAHSAYITRRKALYHVALSLETNDTLDVGQDSKRSQNRSKTG